MFRLFSPETGGSARRKSNDSADGWLPMSDGDYPQRLMSQGVETDRWLDDEYEAFALDYAILEADPNDPR